MDIIAMAEPDDRDEIEEWVEFEPENYTEYMEWQHKHGYFPDGMTYDDPFNRGDPNKGIL